MISTPEAYKELCWYSKLKMLCNFSLLKMVKGLNWEKVVRRKV